MVKWMMTEGVLEFYPSEGATRPFGATACERFAQYGMTPADSAQTEVTMRFPVENCSNKVMVSESLEIF